MKYKYDVITIGGATEDITFFSDKGMLIDNKNDILRQKLIAFEYGAKINVDNFLSTFGGGAANSAVSFSNFGLKTSTILSVGDDIRGENIINNLKKLNVDTGLIQKYKNISSGLSFVLICQNNERIVFSNRAANSDLKITNKEIKELKNTKWVYITSLTGKWKEDMRKIFSIKSINISWNPGHTQLIDGKKNMGIYLKNTKVLHLNKDEAIELVVSDRRFKNMENLFLDNIKNLLQIIKSWGPEIVVITCGRQGSYSYDGLNLYHQGIIKEKRTVDKTGVGDAYGSAFIAGLEIYKGDIKKSLLLGAKNSSSVLSIQGAQNGLLKIKNI